MVDFYYFHPPNPRVRRNPILLIILFHYLLEDEKYHVNYSRYPGLISRLRPARSRKESDSHRAEMFRFVTEY